MTYPVRAFLDRFEDRRGSGDEIIAGLGTRLVLDRLLQIVVEIFIRIVFRRIGREIKDLDFDLVARQPILNRLGVMDTQIVDNQKDLLLRVLDGRFMKSMKIATFSAPL